MAAQEHERPRALTLEAVEQTQQIPDVFRGLVSFWDRITAEGKIASNADRKIQIEIAPENVKNAIGVDELIKKLDPDTTTQKEDSSSIATAETKDAKPQQTVWGHMVKKTDLHISEAFSSKINSGDQGMYRLSKGEEDSVKVFMSLQFGGKSYSLLYHRTHANVSIIGSLKLGNVKSEQYDFKQVYQRIFESDRHEKLVRL